MGSPWGSPFLFSRTVCVLESCNSNGRDASRSSFVSCTRHWQHISVGLPLVTPRPLPAVDGMSCLFQTFGVFVTITRFGSGDGQNQANIIELYINSYISGGLLQYHTRCITGTVEHLGTTNPGASTQPVLFTHSHTTAYPIVSTDNLH